MMLDEGTGLFCNENLRKYENYKNSFFSKYVTFTSLATDVVWIDPEIFFRHSFCLMNSSKMATFIYCQLLMESLINVRRYYDAYAIKETKGQPKST